MSDSVTPEKIDTTGLDASELLALLRDIQEPVAPEGTSLWLITLTVMLTVSLIALVWFQTKLKIMIRVHFSTWLACSDS